MLFCMELTLLAWKRRKVPEEPQRRPNVHWKANSLKNKVRWPRFIFYFFSLGTCMTTRFGTIHKRKISENIDFSEFWSFFKWFFRHEGEIFQESFFLWIVAAQPEEVKNNKNIGKYWTDHGKREKKSKISKKIWFSGENLWPRRGFEKFPENILTQKYLPHIIKSKIWPLHQKLWSNLNFCRSSRFLKMAIPVAKPPIEGYT